MLRASTSDTCSLVHQRLRSVHSHELFLAAIALQAKYITTTSLFFSPISYGTVNTKKFSRPKLTFSRRRRRPRDGRINPAVHVGTFSNPAQKTSPPVYHLAPGRSRMPREERVRRPSNWDLPLLPQPHYIAFNPAFFFLACNFVMMMMCDVDVTWS